MHRIRALSLFNIKTQHKDHSLSFLKHTRMDKRRELSGRVTKQREVLRVQEYVMHMVLLTAGASASVLMVFLMEQWRAWVFIVLNLVLLAILFTSVSSTSDDHQECKNNDDEADRVPVKVEMKKETRQCRWPPAQVDQEVVKEWEEEEWFEIEDKPEEEEVPKLSKEALNERVEAFIVMFRQHLVSDARN
uniref:uncharacterized protein LOC105352042 n=1 Tax=Fragaria vesca subsp. vesca TaxID=101020 RepID=UPI0005C92A26|nr:PREDICTED: uncharacterized protein LOC105352042 [Fragaria vesca subsp. vesca]